MDDNESREGTAVSETGRSQCSLWGCKKKKNETRYYTIYPIRIRQLQLQNELEDEGILLKPLQYYDNQPTVDELLSKPDGLLYVIDEASRTKSGHSFIIGKPFTSTL